MLTVEQNPDGTWDVTDNRRAVAYDRDFDEVLDLVRRRGDRKFELVEADGYRTVQSLSWRP